MLEEVYEKAKMALKEITKVDQSEEIWHVVEYCCEGNSLLSEWFLRRGHAATRLGLPEWDLRTRVAADAVVQKISGCGTARALVGILAMHTVVLVATCQRYVEPRSSYPHREGEEGEHENAAPLLGRDEEGHAAA